MRYLTGMEARDLGVLQEVNRRLLHPRGLALEATVASDGEPIHSLAMRAEGWVELSKLVALARERGLLRTLGWPDEWTADLEAQLAKTLASPDAAVLRVQDHRDDPEGVVFGDGTPEEGYAKLAAFEGLLGMSPARRERFGWVVQPVGERVELRGGDEVEQ